MKRKKGLAPLRILGWSEPAALPVITQRLGRGEDGALLSSDYGGPSLGRVCGRHLCQRELVQDEDVVDGVKMVRIVGRGRRGGERARGATYADGWGVRAVVRAAGGLTGSAGAGRGAPAPEQLGPEERVTDAFSPGVTPGEGPGVELPASGLWIEESEERAIRVAAAVPEEGTDADEECDCMWRSDIISTRSLAS